MDEFGIIRHFFAGRISSLGPEVVLGQGDDCALFSVPPGYHACISTDTFTAGVHFPADLDPADIAWRAMAANLSDLAAMGAVPLGCVLALTLDKGQVNEGWLDQFSSGLGEAVDRWGIPLMGGNLSRGPLSLTFTVIGKVAEGQALLRTGAAVDDDIWVSGWPGEAAAGLQRLQLGQQQPAHLLQRYTRPQPRLVLGQKLIGLASSALDISDGLLADLAHLFESADLGALVALDDLPLSGQVLDTLGKEEATRLLLTGGDDYELCFTAPAANRMAIAALSAELQLPLTRIGTVTPGAGIWLQAVGSEPVPATQIYSKTGYQHIE
ncbi:MAG: thiamine-phosphate kinase [Pseudomonadales bacterium]|nr:thiamine-phosphate kinase [Pseudomonadales bacterium]